METTALNVTGDICRQSPHRLMLLIRTECIYGAALGLTFEQNVTSVMLTSDPDCSSHTPRSSTDPISLLCLSC